MKDMYSFHANQSDLDAFYERSIDAYRRVFERCGIGGSTLLTAASGGMFSKFSHEFQTITPHGEDVVYLHPGRSLGINRELLAMPDILRELGALESDGSCRLMEERKAIEVGNIFKLGARFSDAFNLGFLDDKGLRNSIVMGCYGIGSSRLMGAVVETLSDEKGLIWPAAISPYSLHLISLVSAPESMAQIEQIYLMLQGAGHEVLFDDRVELRAGERFAESDLLGLPWRLVVSEKTLSQNAVECKSRSTGETRLIPIERLTGEGSFNFA